MTYDIYAHAVTEKVLTTASGKPKVVGERADRYWKGGYASYEAAKEEAARLAIRHGIPFHVRRSITKGEADGDGRLEADGRRDEFTIPTPGEHDGGDGQPIGTTPDDG